MMNIHQLELFYYVTRHGGISRAVRHMPYGIQQPAISSQLLQLEQNLGVKLFERQPFRLTAAGGAAVRIRRAVLRQPRQGGGPAHPARPHGDRGGAGLHPQGLAAVGVQ